MGDKKARGPASASGAKIKLAGGRAAGRRDPDRSKASLLLAARHEFARRGFAGARVDQIAALAGFNKQLVYHYFGDKDSLYSAVLEGVYEEIREAESALDLSGLSPDLAIRRLVEFSFDLVAQTPDVVALLNDENRLGAPHMPGSSAFSTIHLPLVAKIGEALEAGKVEGMFRPGVEPTQLYISIASMCNFYFSNGRTLSAIFGRDLSTAAAQRKRRQHVVNLVMNSLRP